MKLYGGIDLHSNHSVVTLLDENDRLIYERRLANELDIILVELAAYREALGRAGGGIDVQRVLVSRWIDGDRLHGALIQSRGKQTL
jgi:hypothetical protein